MSSQPVHSFNASHGNLPNSTPVLDLHRGATDKDMVTSCLPLEVMKRVLETLRNMGVQIDEGSTYKYRCVRPRREEGGNGGEPSQTGTPLYGAVDGDMGGEVVFSVELTTLANLPGTYSLDIRRLKGNLRSYKFLYDTIRDRVALSSL